MIWKTFLDFIITFWREIVAVLSAVITVVLYLIKRRPLINLIDSIKEDILEILPAVICKVESDGNGQRKKNAVCDFILKYVKKKYKVDLTEDMLDWLSFMIEDILSTPQKKEGI